MRLGLLAGSSVSQPMARMTIGRSRATVQRIGAVALQDRVRRSAAAACSASCIRRPR